MAFRVLARYVHYSWSRLLGNDVCKKLALVGALEQKHPGLRDTVKSGVHNVLAFVANRQFAFLDALLE